MQKNIIKIINRQDSKTKGKFLRFFFNFVILFSLVLSVFSPLITKNSEAAINKQINYQGKLTNTSNVAVANGTYNMEFKLYDSTPSVIWTETRTGGNRVQVTNGLFSVLLGEVNPLTGVNFNQTLTLGINIGGTAVTPTWDGEMTPRKKLGAVPAAIEAENALNATNVGITNDIATATSVFPTWVTANTGYLPAKTTSTKLSFVPSTGILTSTGFAGTTVSASTSVSSPIFQGISAATTLGNVAYNTAITSNVWGITGAGVVSGLTGLTSIGNVTLTGANIIGASPLSFDGATADGIKTIFAITNPTTTTKTITFPNATGTVALTSDIPSVAGFLNLDQTTPQTTIGTFTFPKVVATTDITTPLIVGGSAVGSNIIYKSTTGAGTVGGIAHQFTGGTNGGTVIATMLNNGNFGIGTTGPGYKLDVSGDIRATTNYRSSTSDIILSDTSGTVFRGVRASAWADSVNTRFFQVGSSSDNIAFTTQSGVTANRAMISSASTQITNGSYITTNVPTGIFEVSNGTSGLFNVLSSGNVGIGTTSPTAYLNIKAGTATAGTAPLKFTSGTNLTTAEAGAVEWNGTNLFITQTTGPTRKTIAFTTDIPAQVYPSVGVAVSTGTAWGTSLTVGTGANNLVQLNASSQLPAVSGVNLTSLTAGNLTGTIPSTVLGNSTVYIGTTAVALNRASAVQALTGISSISFDAESSDAMSISRTINTTGTYFDFNLADDNNNDWWRWRFTPSGSTVYDAMTLIPVSNGVANLSVSGGITLGGNLTLGANTITTSNTTVVSNLNADMLDGYHANNLPYLPTGTDNWVNITGDTMSGTLSFQQPVGLGFANGQYIKDNGNGGLVIYSAAAMNLNSTSLTANGNTVWHAGNDGSTSGLDADLLDGLHASSFQSALTNPVTGTGTLNYIPKFTATGSTIGNSQIFDNGTNVGIGTAGPNTRLQIGAKVQDDSSYTYDANSLMVVHQTPTGTTVLNDPKTVLMLARQGSSGQAYGAGAAFNLSRYENSGVSSRTRLDISLANNTFDVNSNNVMTLLSSGNVGIGIASPTQKLHVAGNAYITSQLAVGGNQGLDVQTNVTIMSANNAAGGTSIYGINYNGAANSIAVKGYGYITSGAGTNYGVYGSVDNASPLATTNIGGYFSATATGGTGYALITGAGNVGIGTATPTAKLTVAGSLDFGNSGYYIGAGSWGMRNTTPYGYIEFGPANGGYAHVYTDMPTFYFNKELLVNGNTVWNAGNDGTTSGLDADLLDGLHASSFAASGSISGTQNYVSKFNAAGTGVVNSQIFDNGTNVGIGNTSPTGKLDIIGSYSDVSLVSNSVAVANFRTPGHVQMAISTQAASPYTTSLQAKHTTADGNSYPLSLNPLGGNVGIGTASPATTLDVRNATPIITVGTVGGTDGGIYFGNGAHGVRRNYSGVNDVGLYTSSADIYLSAAGNSVTNQFVLKNSGNVGIGTTGPGMKLDVSGSHVGGLGVVRFKSTDDAILVLDATGTTQSGIRLKRDGTDKWFAYNYGTSDKFMIDPSGGGNGLLTIQPNGNVGIGTTGPTARLHVYETAALGGTIGNYQTIANLMSNTGGTPESLYAWGYRERTGTDWTSTSMMIGVGMNGYHDTPGVNTRLWWKLDPYDNKMHWGSGANSLMTLTTSGNVGIGTTTPTNLLTVGPAATLNANYTTPSLRVQGTNVHDGAGYYGSYGGMIFNASNGYTASARRFLVTNALQANKFAIIRSVDSITDPTLGISGAITSGIADFVIDNTGAATFGSSVSASSFSGAGTGLTGTASGLSIGGNAATATTATTATSSYYQLSQDRNRATMPAPNSRAQQTQFDFANAGIFGGTVGSYGGVMTWAPYDGNTASTGDASYQIGVVGTAANGGGYARMLIRKGIDTTWNSWQEILTSSNVGSYSASSISGTVNQITASASIGAVTLSLPSDLRAPGTFNAVTSIATGAGAGTNRIDASGNLVNIGTIGASGDITSSGGDNGFYNSGTAAWYMFDLGTRGASAGRYGMGLTDSEANRQMSFHIPNYAAYGSAGTVPSFSWRSNGADELMKLTSATGDLWIKGTVTAASFSGAGTGLTGTAANLNIGGNAGTATTLQTARTINGVSFNGSANIAVPSLYDTNYRRITNPGGAEYVTQTPTVTGAIAITMPVWTSGMYKMTIEVYEYTTNESFTLVVGGHNSDVTWYNEFAYITANQSVDRRFSVRFGRTAGGLPVIYIGELGSTWSYPQVYVTDFQHGYSGNSLSFATGWSVGFETAAFAGVTRTQTNPQIGYAVSTNTANSVVLRDASGNFSAGAITASSFSGTSASLTGNLSVSTGNSTGGGIILADDGDIVDLNDSYLSLRFSSGVRVFSANRGGSAVITLGNNGIVTASSFSGAGTGLTGTASGLSIGGNAATATTFSTTRTNYKGVTDGAVAGQLMWKNYGNNHTIFDASNGTAPDGTAVNNTNSTVAWAGTYPTLMGWNGTSTYGVRVDVARLADTASAVSFNGGLTTTSSPTFAGLTLNGNLALGANTITTTNTGLVSSLNADRVDSMHASEFFQYQGFTLDANTMSANRSGFSYASNAPHTGPIVDFNASGYDLQMSAAYSGGGEGFSFRTRNGDTATWNNWNTIWHEGNDGSGTGLDADTVDSYHLNQNVLTTSAPTFAGMTLNGNLALGANTITTTNTTVVSNLNADLFDGGDSSTFIRTSGTQDRSGNLNMYSTDISGVYSSAAIELREVNLVTTAQSSWAYAPAISFHWGGRNQTQLKMLSDGTLALGTGDGVYTGFRASTGSFSGALTSTTLDTGQGAYELYAMNQNVQTTNSPTFAGMNLNGNLALGGNTITTTNTGVVANLNADLLDGITSTNLFNNMGQGHSTQTDFNTVADFGARFLQGATNGPGTGSSQFYTLGLGLGSDYAFGSYALQFAIPRYTGTDKYLSIRTREASTWGAWSKIYAGYADTAGNADTVDSKHLTDTTGNNGVTWDRIPFIKTDGVMEVGQYIDFHTASNSGVDYTARLYSNSGVLTTTSNLVTGLINGQTISSAANFTGTMAVATSITTPSYLVTPAEGNGVKFWSSDDYKISMGVTAAQYQYGPVTDYSIKMNMGNGIGRGFTWGQNGVKPIAALNSTSGNMEIAGGMTTYSYQGNGNVGGTGTAAWFPSGIYSAGTNWLYGSINTNGAITDTSSRMSFNPAGNSYFNGGRLFIGANAEATSSANLYVTGTTAANGSTSAIAGILGGYTFNPSAGGVQVGNRFVVTNSPTTNANTGIGEIIRMVDGTSLANTVRGLDVTANGGGNVQGTNTGIRSNGATFGVQGLTSALAGGVAVPAALYGESTGTTQGDVLRLYSNTVTSANSFATFYHDTSTFTGTGLLMNLASGSGGFTGDFINLKKNNTSMFKVTNAGITSLGLSGTASTNAVCSSLANGTAPGAGVAYELRDCNAAPAADYAEMYPVTIGIDYGDVVVTGVETVMTYGITDGNIDWNKEKGKVTKLVKSNAPYQRNVIGIVSDNYGDFSSTGNNIKEVDNPMPVALSGRVPVKVASTSEEIYPGDYLTTSNESGRATRANKPGTSIGKALEGWTPNSGKDTVMIYVEQGYYDGGDYAETTFNGLTFFKNDTRFVKGVVFESQVEFIVPPLFNNDTAGFAVVKAGTNKVDVIFGTPYIATPVVSTNITIEKEKTGIASLFNKDSFFNENVQSIVIDKDENGFSIVLNKNATQDIRFSWIALSVKDPKVFESVIEGLVIDSGVTAPTTIPITDPVEIATEVNTTTTTTTTTTEVDPMSQTASVVEILNTEVIAPTEVVAPVETTPTEVVVEPVVEPAPVEVVVN